MGVMVKCQLVKKWHILLTINWITIIWFTWFVIPTLLVVYIKFATIQRLYKDLARSVLCTPHWSLKLDKQTSTAATAMSHTTTTVSITLNCCLFRCRQICARAARQNIPKLYEHVPIYVNVYNSLLTVSWISLMKLLQFS